jgi:hypothetical protein
MQAPEAVDSTNLIHSVAITPPAYRSSRRVPSYQQPLQLAGCVVWAIDPGGKHTLKKGSLDEHMSHKVLSPG